MASCGRRKQHLGNRQGGGQTCHSTGRRSGNTNIQDAVDNPPRSMVQERHQQSPARQSRSSFQASRRSTTRQTHPTAVRPPVTKGGWRARSAQNRHGKTQRLPPSHCSSTGISVRMRTGNRDSRPLPLPMQKMDGIPNGDARMHRHPQEQYFLLSRREIAIG